MVKKDKYGRTNIIELSEWFYQKKDSNKAYFMSTFSIRIKYRSAQVGI
jgi:hypothetical protein